MTSECVIWRDYGVGVGFKVEYGGIRIEVGVKENYQKKYQTSMNNYPS